MIQTIAILAQAAEAAPQPATENQWVINLVVAVILAVGGLFTGRKMKESEIQKREISPNPLHVKEQRDPTWAEVASLERRMEAVERDLRELREEQKNQYRELMKNGEERTEKILAGVNESANQIYKKMDTLITEVRKESAARDEVLEEKIEDHTRSIGRLEGAQLKSKA